MKKTKLNQIIEYLSLTFILSYFFAHNISLVMIGIIFSLYLMNVNIIDKQKKSIIKNLATKEESKQSNRNDKLNHNTINIKSTKEDAKLTLVEEIEELGFIPSIIKKDNKNAA